jgi:hypothetical protein
MLSDEKPPEAAPPTPEPNFNEATEARDRMERAEEVAAMAAVWNARHAPERGPEHCGGLSDPQRAPEADERDETLIRGYQASLRMPPRCPRCNGRGIVASQVGDMPCPQCAEAAPPRATTPEPMTDEALARLREVVQGGNGLVPLLAHAAVREIDRLRASLAPSRDSGALPNSATMDVADYLRLKEYVATLERDAARMREAATRYVTTGRHAHTCNLNSPLRLPCDCGFAALQDALSTEAGA